MGLDIPCKLFWSNLLTPTLIGGIFYKESQVIIFHHKFWKMLVNIIILKKSWNNVGWWLQQKHRSTTSELKIGLPLKVYKLLLKLCFPTEKINGVFISGTWLLQFIDSNGGCAWKIGGICGVAQNERLPQSDFDVM